MKSMRIIGYNYSEKLLIGRRGGGLKCFGTNLDTDPPSTSHINTFLEYNCIFNNTINLFNAVR